MHVYELVSVKVRLVDEFFHGQSEPLVIPTVAVTSGYQLVPGQASGPVEVGGPEPGDVGPIGLTGQVTADSQVRSLTQFYSVDFSQSRICFWKVHF